jgi:TatD DNase family protein
VVHCFTGNKHEVRAYLDLDMYIGITGWICDERRNGDLLEAMHYIPVEKMMIETDSPYLKPRTVKSKSIRNEPAYLIYILKKVAEIKKCHLKS